MAKNINEDYNEQDNIAQLLLLDELWAYKLDTTPKPPERVVNKVFNKFLSELSQEDKNFFECAIKWRNENQYPDRESGFETYQQHLLSNALHNTLVYHVPDDPHTKVYIQNKAPIPLQYEGISEELIEKLLFDKEMAEGGGVGYSECLGEPEGLAPEMKKELGLENKNKSKKPTINESSKYTIYVKNPKTGEVKQVKIGGKNEEVYEPQFQEPEKPKPKKKAKKIAGKDVGELLNEIVDPDSVNVDKLNVKDELCPMIWDGDKMNPEVRKHLLKNAAEFIKFSNIEDKNFKDIILTGSMANYNWHDGSDLDVHVLMDTDQVGEDDDFVEDYFKTKKSLWAEKMPVQVKGHDVEQYIQDINEPHASTGVYSLLNDKWLTKPIKSMVALDIPNIQIKAAGFMDQIDELLTTVNADQAVASIEKLMDKLKKYRKTGLDDEGEFSTENLVFKILRNTGYLEKLVKKKENLISKELTLENVSMYDPDINNGSVGNQIA